MKVGDKVVSWPFVGTVRAIATFSNGDIWYVCEENTGTLFIRPPELLRTYMGPPLPLVRSKA